MPAYDSADAGEERTFGCRVDGDGGPSVGCQDTAKLGEATHWIVEELQAHLTYDAVETAVRERQRVSIEELELDRRILQIAPGYIQHGAGNIAGDDLSVGADKA